MRSGFLKVLTTGIVWGGLNFLPTALFSNNNEGQNINRFECSSCHGGTAPVLTADQGLNIIDPDTMGAVTRYTPGKTYTIRVRFNNPSGGPNWRNAYVLHIAEISTGEALRAGSIVNSGGIGTVTDTGPTDPQSNSRVVNSMVKNAVDNPELSWQAPSSGKVRFQLVRMESNNNNGQGGDRVSQTLEQTILLAEGASTSGDDEESDGSDTDSTGPQTSSGSGFDTNLAAGCGSLSTPENPFSLMWLLSLILCLGACRQRAAARWRD